MLYHILKELLLRPGTATMRVQGRAEGPHGAAVGRRLKGTAMPKAFVSTVINAPIERVWRVIGDFNGLPAWMPGMKDSVIEPGKSATEIGAVRKLSMAGTKDILRERLEELAPEERLISYSVLEGPLPVKIIRTTMRLRPITDTYGTLGEWSTEFEAAKGAEAAGVAHMERVFGAGFRGLKRHLGV
jgi:uncharacterized protein YndB with AHSA1/START domain